MTSAVMTEQVDESGGGWLLLLLEGVLLAGLALVVVWVVQLMQDPRHFPVQDIKVEGDFRYLDASQLQQQVRAAVTGSFFSTRLTDVRQVADAMPWVADVSLRREWPGTLHVQVTEHVPVARWGGQGLLDREGELFFPRQIGSEMASLPLLRGPEGREQVLWDTYRQIDARLQRIGLGLVSLKEDARHALSLYLNNGITLRLGRDHLEGRMQRFITAYPGELAARAQRIDYVDLRYSNGFSVGWKAQPEQE